jgi:Glycosyltransferases involved in cell wall biogenesis
MLTIAIPTFNRAEKVKRLLSVIKDEIFSSRLQDQVAVIVSNNASTDETHSAVSGFLNCGLNLKYYRQLENLGFDGNLRFLYRQAKTRYVWFMADDDLPLKGAIAKIAKTLEMCDPDVLLFSFIQPPGSTAKTFDFPETVHLVTETVPAIECVLHCRKVSIYVLRKCFFTDRQWCTLDENLGDGWYFISLAFSVLEASSNLKLAAISEPLATCDEGFVRLPWTPEAFLCMDKMVSHPFALVHIPDLPKLYCKRGYYNAIQFAFAAKVGALLPESPEEYDTFIKRLEWRIPVLLKAPRFFLQLIALKFQITWLWPKIKYIVKKVRN